MRAVAEEYERRLWEELNLLLAEVVPEGASPENAERAIMLALIGHDAEIADLFQRMRTLARTERGYLRERMQEDSPVADLERQLREAETTPFPGGPPRQRSAIADATSWPRMLPLLLAVLVVSFFAGLLLGDRIFSPHPPEAEPPPRELPNAGGVWRPPPSPKARAPHPRMRNGS